MRRRISKDEDVITDWSLTARHFMPQAYIDLMLPSLFTRLLCLFYASLSFGDVLLILLDIVPNYSFLLQSVPIIFLT